MNNIKNQTKKEENKKTLLEEYKEISEDVLSGYNSINGYHCQNNEWRDIKNGYGVELEFSNDDYNTRDRLSRFLNFKYKMNIESDTSISGCYPMEIISQPYTQKEWMSNKKKIAEFFELINYTGLNTDNSTGFHIHISKKLIGKNDVIRENNINKLILILENFKDTFIKFSRRDKARMRYCNFFSNYWGEKTYKDLYTIQQKKDYSHSVAINKDSKTYEIRIFKGTKNYIEFIATLQLVFNLVDIIQKEDLTSITFNDIINYNKDFKELITYCKENDIKNGSKIIDKTKIKELLRLKENTKILKENYNYNKYIDRVRTLILNNMELYNESKEDYNNNNEIYNQLRYIFTQTYKNNNSMFYQVKEINDMLSNYSTKYIFNYKTNENIEKRVFNKGYKNKYSEKLNKLEKLIKDKGGVI